MSVPVASNRLISPPASLAGLIANKELQVSQRRGRSLGFALGPPLHHLPAIRGGRGGRLGGRGRRGGNLHLSSRSSGSVLRCSGSGASCTGGLVTSR